PAERSALSHRPARALSLGGRCLGGIAAAATAQAGWPALGAAAREDTRRDPGHDGRAARPVRAAKDRDASVAPARSAVAAPVRIRVLLRGLARSTHGAYRNENGHGKLAADGSAAGPLR